MENSFLIFGDHAFRRWPIGSEYRSPINRALFESWANALTDLDPQQAEVAKPQIVAAARRLMTSDREYIDSISGSTGDPKRVQTRFSRARDVVAEASGS
jgi:hypothetical protein